LAGQQAIGQDPPGTDGNAVRSQPPPERPRGAATRVILLANETVAAPGVRDRIKQLVGGENAEVFVVAPALTSSAFKHVTGEVDEAIEEARKRLDESVRALKEAGLRATGDVGDSDPTLALGDALRRFPADHVVISTHPEGRSKWLERDVVEKARTEVDVPVTHVVVDMEKGGAEVAAVERAPGPAQRDGNDTVTAYDLPRMPPRDVAAIVAGVVGTIVLGVLAIACAGNISEEGMSAGCAIRIGLAVAAFIVTVFHVVALLFMGSVRYHGRGAAFMAWTLLLGIPPAILVSAIVG
jgi:hypothetical protein